jgi:phosphohistidine phosphatase
MSMDAHKCPAGEWEAVAMTIRTLLLLRHAQTEDIRPGHRDRDRRLTITGEAQAGAVGRFLADGGVAVDRVLCSSAVRTRQTLELVGQSLAVDPARIDVSDRLYSAGTDTLVEAIRELDQASRTALVIGHAPALPGVAYQLADPDSSTPEASAAIADRFPAATLARLQFEGEWPELDRAALVEVRLPAEA